MLKASVTWARGVLPCTLAVAATACVAAGDAGDDDVDAVEAAVVGDQCPAPNGGISWNDRYRFMYGVNYAWNQFGGDFGGITRWNVRGVSASQADHEAKLADMRAHGANVIRWWMFPEFRGEGVRFDGSETPLGLGGTTVADLQKALELAERQDVYLMLCLFSFDNFRPSHDTSGIHIPGLAPIVRSTSKLDRLITNVVRPLARAAEASPYRHRLVAWDVINEPEWAISGRNPYGDQSYTPMSELDAVSHAEMERFVSRTTDALKAESSALVTVGGAAVKWGKAWSRVDIDFYQFHIYDWVNEWWPYYLSPEELGVGDKPVVMGEFPIASLSGVPYQDLVESFYANGYAGAMGWDYGTATGAQLDQMRDFASRHACETDYSAGYGELVGSSGGTTTGGGTTSGGGTTTGGGTTSGGGTCTDTPPDSRYTCAQQAGWGKCSETWMRGFCDRSCGRCGG
ncbi:uncharacterized protein SOCE26_093420 [Sorangium cellulosum]|uniref:Uncharacterized protein n=1 Tax=Sorangium cellulosum TaxID=56 RepID=A0A2L0F895_SORCE|nr:hypothetical protein [Sorangium cellulosum]AUX47818.1 uncharacterized protein SOCE26_093420 [Sorangium cellulosum]